MGVTPGGVSTGGATSPRGSVPVTREVVGGPAILACPATWDLLCICRLLLVSNVFATGFHGDLARQRKVGTRPGWSPVSFSKGVWLALHPQEI